MSTKFNVLIITGSLREKSYNAAIGRQLAELAPDNLVFSHAPSVGTLPHYNQDVQDAGFPKEVMAFADAISAADGLIFVTPEYNYSVPGVLKNAIDWVSRLRPVPFDNKVGSIISASGGAIGGARMQYHLRQILVAMNIHLVNRPEIMVGTVQNKTDGEGGKITDETTLTFIGNHLKELARLLQLHHDDQSQKAAS
ncbi:hypothetical protein W822_10880 [Advenella kashmirensis W13003]|uniref:NADPH-dependent FMN reductase-like domain-containing protein n=1 Tax=Advenella kashmirensis W13003 TaxID=1424334 RepID=V8QVE5_9BURK|nr:NADPH-dependent FMN reductase [Advenella kashmirensis]ETF03290.1 hypothetical protein W822_10880 [Advenella kashmirensis W13003]